MMSAKHQVTTCVASFGTSVTGDVVLHDPPDPGVVLAGHRGDLRHRHRGREAAHQRLETTT
jgi:hypothetical protein